VGWVLAGAGAADVDVVACAFGGELGSGIDAGCIALLVAVRFTTPSGSVLVSEMPLGGTVVVVVDWSVLFCFFLRLFRECVVDFPEPGGTCIILGRY